MGGKSRENSGTNCRHSARDTAAKPALLEDEQDTPPVNCPRLWDLTATIEVDGRNYSLKLSASGAQCNCATRRAVGSDNRSDAAVLRG